MGVDEAQARKQSGSGLRVLLSFATVVIIVAGLKAASALFIPVMLGLFLALLSLPILNWLAGHRIPRGLAVFTTVLIDLLILFGIVFLASGVIGNFQDKSSEYAERLRKQAAEFSVTMDAKLEELGDFWTRTGVDGIEGEETEESREEEGGLGPSIPTFKDLFERYWDSNRVVEFVGQTDLVARFTSLASQTFFALMVMIFVLSEAGRFAAKVRAVLQVRGPDLGRFQNTSQDIQKYLGIKTGVSFATGVLATLVCLIFRVDFPLLWGLIAFLFNYVPAIGSIVAAVPAVLLALIMHGFWPAAGVLGCYLIINIAIGNFLEPTLLGDRFGLSTLIVILSVLFWGFIWGPVGMLLAVPLTMFVKVMLDNSSDFRWISAFMGKGIVEAPADEEALDSAAA